MVLGNNLENINGPLTTSYPRIVQGTLQHAHQLSEERLIREHLREGRFYVAESAIAVPSLDGHLLYLTRGEKNNLVLQNLSEVEKRSKESVCYVHDSRRDIERIVSDPSTSRFDLGLLTDFDMGGGPDDASATFSLPLDNPDQLNDEQKRYVAAALTQERDYSLAVERLKMAGIERASFSFISPKSLTNLFNYRTKEGLKTPALIMPAFLWNPIKNGGCFATDVYELSGSYSIRAVPLAKK